MDGGIGLVVPWSQPGPRTELVRSREPLHITDFGDEDRRQDRTDTRYLLDRPVPGITAEPASDEGGEPRLLGVEGVDELQQRQHSLGVGLGEGHPSECRSTGDTEQVRDRDLDSGLAEHRVHLRLEVRTDRHQLRPVAHQLPQLTHLGWGDPCLGQSVHAQQIRQIRGVADVVLDSTVPKPFETQWVCEVDGRAGGLQRVDCLVPPVRGFEHHLGVRSGAVELPFQRVRVVDDPGYRQLLALAVVADDHRPPPVQIDSYELRTWFILVHEGVTLPLDSGPDTPTSAGNHEEREAPAPFHHIKPRTDADRDDTPKESQHSAGSTRVNPPGVLRHATGSKPATPLTTYKSEVLTENAVRVLVGPALPW